MFDKDFPSGAVKVDSNYGYLSIDELDEILEEVEEAVENTKKPLFAKREV